MAKLNADDILKKYGYGSGQESPNTPPATADDILKKYGYSSEQESVQPEPTVTPTPLPTQSIPPQSAPSVGLDSSVPSMGPMGSDQSFWFGLRNIPDIIKTFAAKTASDIVRGVTFGGVNIEQGTILGKDMFPNVADPRSPSYDYNQRLEQQRAAQGITPLESSLAYSGVDPDTAHDVNTTLIRTGNVLPFLKNTLLDFEIKPGEWVGMGKSVAPISRTLWKNATNPAIQKLLSKAPATVKPIVPAIGRLFNSGLTGAVVGGTSSVMQGQPETAGESALSGAAVAGILHTVMGSINTASKLPVLQRVGLLRQTVNKIAEITYGEGKFATFEEAQRAAAQYVQNEVNAHGGIRKLKIKNINEMNRALDKLFPKQEPAEPVKVNPESSTASSTVKKLEVKTPGEAVKTPADIVPPETRTPKPRTLQERREMMKQTPGKQSTTPPQVESPGTDPAPKTLGERQALVAKIKAQNAGQEAERFKVGDTIYDQAGREFEVTKLDSSGYHVKNKRGTTGFVGIKNAFKNPPSAATQSSPEPVAEKTDMTSATPKQTGEVGPVNVSGPELETSKPDVDVKLKTSKKEKPVIAPEDISREPKKNVPSFKLKDGKFPFSPDEFGIADEYGHKHQVFRVSKMKGLYNGEFAPHSIAGEKLNYEILEGKLGPGDIISIDSAAAMQNHRNIYQVKSVSKDRLEVEEISEEKAIEILSSKSDIIKSDGDQNARTENSGTEPAKVSADQIRPDGAGSLEKQPVADVQGGATGRNASKKSIRGTGTGEGVKSGTDRERIEPGPSGGDRSERVHPVIKQAEKEPRLKRNYRITDADQIGTGTEGERLRNNVEAIRILKKIMTEGRKATPEEQTALVRYVGWGGLSNVFNERITDGQMSRAREELKRLLSKEEYDSAMASVKNAHYTSPEVIRGIYEGIQHLGFNRGYVLEPAAGIGHFIGLMPEKMALHSNVTGIELDTITGNIAKHLYPDSDIRVMGFEKADLSPIYDLAVSNVPFGNYGVYDEKIPKNMRSSIHNYFFAKALETVRPGGLIVFITSRYTMDAKPNASMSEAENANARKYINNRANFLGAIRLPFTAFKGTAGTEVVTDIIVLQKKGPGVPDKSEAWLEVKRSGTEWNSPFTNEYYHNHPEMILGKETMTGSMYGGNQYNVEPTGGNLGEKIVNAFKKLPGAVYKSKSIERIVAPKVTEMIPAPGDLKEGSFKVQGGKVYQNRKGILNEIPVTPAEASRISKQIELIDAIKENMRLQYGSGTEEQIKQSQQKLNQLYDSFVKEHGLLHERKNSIKISDDPEFPRLLSLENWDSKTGKATKADIFTKRTIQKHEPPTKADNAHEALIYSLNENGFVDLEYMSKLTGDPESKIISDLGARIFQNPDSKQWETSDAYLSGNVRVKLKIAESYAHLEPKYQRNVEALKKVIPEDVTPSQINVRLGATWIPVEVYQEFVKSIFGNTVDISYSSALGEWRVGKAARYGSLATNEYGTVEKDFFELYRLALNQQRPQVFDVKYDGEREYKVLNQEKTLAAIAKQEKIQKAFEDWIWEDKTWAEKLTRIYNDTNNSIVLRSWDGSHMTFPGMNPIWAEKFRSHQKNAVWKGVQEGNSLLAHAVGAGKTFEQVAIAMELKRLGICRKIVWSVPKHLLVQSADSALELYPGAKILMAGDKSFGKADRKEFMNKIAAGDWDLVIISHDNLKSIPMSESAVREHMGEQIDQLQRAIVEEVENGTRSNRGLVKKLEAAKARLEARLQEEIASIKRNQDVGNIFWEETGIDGLIIDEAHLFKNLFYTTKMEKVAGLGNQQGTQKTTDLYMKIRHLQRLNGGRGVVFATGTPVANSIAELYHMMRYLRPDLLEERGISSFDSWVAQFAKVTPELEMKPAGNGYRLKDRLSSFINLPELKQIFRTFTDIQTSKMLNLPVPEIATGKPEEISAEPRQELLDYIQTLAQRASLLKGKPEKGGDNMLKISGDGRKASLDMRLINPALPDDPGSKINLTVQKVVDIYHETASYRGTQVIFLDLSTPGKEGGRGAGKAAEDEVDLKELELELTEDEKALKSTVSADAIRIYDDIKSKLIAKGIPANEIAFIHDAKTVESRHQIFDGMNSGKLRILLGSTGKLGTGANIQERLVALYNLDAPWKPAEVEQRVGRILRQGNKHMEWGKPIHIFNCVTKKSFDARTWHILKMKSRFIEQLMNDDMTVREIGDATGDAVLNFAEVAAIASDNPDIIRDIELDNIVSKYRAMKADYERSQRSMKEKLNYLPGHILELKEKAENIHAAASARQDISGDKFSITLGKKTFTSREEADLYIKKLAQENFKGKLGKIAGINIKMDTARGESRIFINDTDYSSESSISSLEYHVRNIDKELTRRQEQIRNLEKELSDTEKSISKPFEFDAQLKEAEAESRLIKEKLLKTKDPVQEAVQDIEQAIAAYGVGMLHSEATGIATGITQSLGRVKRAWDVLFGKDDSQIHVSDAAVERVLTATKSPLNIKEQVKTRLQGLGRAFKDVFLYEWTVAKFPAFQNDLRLFKGVARDSQKFALDLTLKILKPLETAREFEIFRRLVFLRDLEVGLADAEPDAQGVVKNIGLTEPQIKAAQDELWKLVEKTRSKAKIKTALWAHDKIFKALWDDLKLRGKVDPAADSRKHYVPHRVLDYMNDVDRRFPSLSRRLKTPYRYYLKGRSGSQRLIDTDYVGITLRHLAKLYMDNATDDFQVKVATKYDQNRKLTRAEKVKLYGKRKVPVPGKLYEFQGKQYIGWQYDPGRQIYPVVMATGKMIPAIGRYKKTYLLPVEIADRLSNFKDSQLNSHIFNALRQANSIYKQMLFSPGVLGIPFQVGNFIGDVISLYANDAPALKYLAKGWRAAKQWQKGQVDKDLKELVKLAEDSRVMESTFMREAGMPYDPKLAQLQPRRFLLRKLNPFTKWQDVSEQRELAPRLAKMYADLKRIERGQMPKSRVVNVEWLNKNGMSHREIAGKLAREVTVDYHKMNNETQRVIRELLLPMFAFYHGNFPNWFNYARRSPLNLAVKILLPMLIMTMWNWIYHKETEEKLPAYYRIMPHIITGYKDSEGKAIIIALATPFDLASKMLGLDIIPDVARRISTNEISWGQGLKEAGESIGFAPWETFQSLLTPIIKAPIEAFMNKSWFNDRQIVPDRLIGTKYDKPMRWQYIVNQWVAPVGTWNRNYEGNVAEGIKKYITKGPGDLPRSVGIRHVDIDREAVNQFYDRLDKLQKKQNEVKEARKRGKQVEFKEAGQLRVLLSFSRQFSSMWKLIERIEQSERPDQEKEMAIKRIKDRMNSISERVLKTAQ